MTNELPEEYYNQELQKYADFSKLINELSTLYDERILALQEENEKLRIALNRKNNGLHVFKKLKSWTRKILFKTVRFLYHLLRRVADKMGLKSRFKKTRIYKKLFISGYADKLQ
jgi:uncharacterized small protein (DUF1192 family)